MAWRERSAFNSRKDETSGAEMIECKVIMVGTVSVGKTSLTSRYVKDSFRSTVTTTIGASYMWKKEMFDDKELKFSLWDTAGQEQFHALVPMYFRDAEAVVLVVDVTSSTCNDEAEVWLGKIQQNAPENTVIFLALNKVDLEAERKYSLQDAQAFCEAHSDFDIECGEVSAKSGLGVRETFRRIGERCLDKINAKKAKAVSQLSAHGNKVSLDTGKKGNTTPQKKCC